MKRSMMAAIVAVALLATPMFAGAASAKTHGPCTGYYVTPKTPTAVRIHRVKRLIACAFAWAGIPGETSTAWYVADRESSDYPWAHNTSSDCRGLFQHMGRYWDSRARAYLKRGWFPRHWTPSAYNARANALVTAVMVRRGGWSPWSM